MYLSEPPTGGRGERGGILAKTSLFPHIKRNDDDMNRVSTASEFSVTFFFFGMGSITPPLYLFDVYVNIFEYQLILINHYL